MMQTKTQRPAWSKVLVLGFLLAALLSAASLMLAASKPAHADATFTVNDTGDFLDHNVGDGVCDFTLSEGDRCSLRAAIQEANHPNNPGPDTIEFEIGGSGASGVKTIRPVTALPEITEAVTIDGYSQPGASPNTLLVEGTNAVLNIQLDGRSAGENASGLKIGGTASASVVRGLAINRFARAGVEILGDSNNVEGNFIGTDASGTLDLGNGVGFGGGVLVSGDRNEVGGTLPSQRNLISGNREGVRLSSGGENRVQGNLIGTSKDGKSNLGNEVDGILMVSSSRNVIGSGRNEGFNTIAFNGGDGVLIVSGGGATANRIVVNSIFSNGGLGIDLVGGTENAAGETANDPKDPDQGANNLQNKPVITSAKTSGSTTTIQAKLNSTPNKTFDVLFFSNPSGNEGKTFIGATRVTTNANGNVTYTFTPSQAVSVGQTVTATALDFVGGNTSEFSAKRTVVAQ